MKKPYLSMKLYAVLVLLVLISTLGLTPLKTVNAQVEYPRDQTIFLSDPWSIPGWNPLLSTSNAMTGIMYPSLYLYSPYTDEWIPYAASSYRWIDKYTLEVKIRDEAKWWDGKPVTADDVVYTWELGKRMVVPFITPYWDYLEEVVAIDSKTVQFRTSEKKLNYFQMLGVLSQIILPKHRWEKLEAKYGIKLTTDFKDDNASEIIGAGPYKAYKVTESSFSYIRVDDWWGKDIFGIPNPKYIVYIIPKDNTAAALAFEQGQRDEMTHFIPKIWEMWEVKKLPVRTYYAHPPYFVSGGIDFLWMNYKTKGLDNPAVRRAIAYALNVSEMIEKAYYNYGLMAKPVPIIHTSAAAKYINQTLINEYGWSFNIEKAKKILDDAGIKPGADGIRVLPDGTRLSFTIEVPYGWSDWMMMCDMIASYLKEIGIEVKTNFPDFSVWWQHLTDKKWDLVIGWADASPGFAHPWNAFRSTMDPRLSHPSGNWENYNNPEVISLIDALPRETDPTKIQAIYSKLQEIWLRDIPGVPLFYGAVWYEYSEVQWVGWPNEENGFWFANFWSWPSNMPVLFRLAPKGQTPKEVPWVSSTKFSTSKIFEDLATAPAHGFQVVTTTVTVTVTNTVVKEVTVTTTQVVPTLDVASAGGIGIVAILIGAGIGWLIASRKK
ncbi:MAG: ABC transporter substrate-binding protein [Thermoproteota archaeon]